MGTWVNGGAWIQTSSGQVDFLYRNLEQVTATITKAKNGEWENDFEQQPPYGFSSVIYLQRSAFAFRYMIPRTYRRPEKRSSGIPPKIERSGY
jgi:hypothetical protein